MPFPDMVKSCFGIQHHTNQNITRKPATGSRSNRARQTIPAPTAGYTQHSQRSTPIDNTRESLRNRQSEATPLQPNQNRVNTPSSNIVKLHFIPEAQDLTKYNKKTLIDSPLFLQPETAQKHIKILKIIACLAPKGENFETIIKNITEFLKTIKTEDDFFWVTALTCSFASKLLGQLKNILDSINKGKNLPEEEVIGKNLIHHLNKPWILLISQSGIKNPMTDEDKTRKGNTISSTFHRLINDLFKGMSDKIYLPDAELEIPPAYNKLLQIIIQNIIPMRTEHDSLDNKIKDIHNVDTILKEIIGTLKGFQA